jgi:hypothetical protein|tara:strand:+ start:309 stop:1097 length:789 start_codon:yes stop_codon:yes gene_type:complete
MINDFNEFGHTKTFKVELGDKLTALQNKIYDITKKFIVDHDSNISVEEKIKLPFKVIPDHSSWSLLMREINNSVEKKDIINSKSVLERYKEIFDNPIKFKICVFRARFPGSGEFVPWHQDEASWYLSNDEEVLNKFTAILWLSINGGDKTNSLHLLKYSHKAKFYNSNMPKLFYHGWAEGAGYFNAKFNRKKIDENLCHAIEAKPSEGVLFHPLLLHRSIPEKGINYKPRYSLDMRYYDDGKELLYKTNWFFKMKKLLKRKL